MYHPSLVVAVVAALTISALEASPTLMPRTDTWGGAVSLGPTTSTIIKAITTIIPGAAPNTQNGVLFLWPGMSNGTGDLVQTTLESWADNSWCGATSGQWCVRASLFGSFGQLDGDASPVSGDQKVKIVYTLLEDNDTWRQDVTDADTGEELSTFEYASGPFMRGFGTGTECNEDCTPTIVEQRYINTEITLAGSDPNFGNTIASSQGATYSGLTSSNDGTVWTISEIRVPAMA
ncbi:Fc.00g093670.m01.CDS01 [Cosmosporella sp. VM-42]